MEELARREALGVLRIEMHERVGSRQQGAEQPARPGLPLISHRARMPPAPGFGKENKGVGPRNGGPAWRDLPNRRRRARMGGMVLFDTHAHFDAFEAEGSVAAVLARAAAAGVARMCAVGSSEASNELVVRLAQEHPEALVAAVGYDRDQLDRPRGAEKLAELATRPGVVAVGEIGLDYYYSAETASAQRALFGQMLEFAAERKLPVVVHSRYADDDTVDLLGEFSTVWKKVFHSMENLPPLGILHCFTGDAAFAEELLALGFFISFSGIVSFNNAGPLREVAKLVPEDRLLIETDCPYLTPKPFRGKVNEPAFVARVAEVLAEARGTAAEALAASTTANAKRVFQLEA
ncbi:MAG: TatD family deoxyribonuclease [Opitutae bacterium]|nr:TatD family deoxyribonuclease [Opitutae bacterium]